MRQGTGTLFSFLFRSPPPPGINGTQHVISPARCCQPQREQLSILVHGDRSYSNSPMSLSLSLSSPFPSKPVDLPSVRRSMDVPDPMCPTVWFKVVSIFGGQNVLTAWAGDTLAFPLNPSRFCSGRYQSIAREMPAMETIFSSPCPLPPCSNTHCSHHHHPIVTGFTSTLNVLIVHRLVLCFLFFLLCLYDRKLTKPTILTWTRNLDKP